MVDNSGTTAFTWTRGNQLLTEQQPFVGDTVTNTYLNRLRTSLALGQPSGAWTNGFSYDSARRLSTVISPAGTFSYAYPSGLRSTLVRKLTLGNGAYITNTYDNVARLLTNLLNDSANGMLDKYSYIYNRANQRTNVTRADNSYYGFVYDNIAQLTNANGSVPAESRGYVYDAAWNLSDRTNNGAVTAFTVDNKNQLKNEAGLPCTYDASGNITAEGDPLGGVYVSYVYDDENRLTEVATNYNVTQGPLASSTQPWTSDFVYDGMGRLRKRFEYINGVPSTTNEYIYDGRRVIQERDGGNGPKTVYTRGNDLSATMEGAGGIGGLLSVSFTYSSGNWLNHYYYFADGNGNVTYITDSNQNAVATYRYDPFGNTISSSGSLADANVYRFSSKEIHANSGMYYYGFRFYDPNLQRWINRDPISEKGGLNLYGFTGNNPLLRLDRDGYTWYINPNAKNPHNTPTVVCKNESPVPYLPKAFTGADLAALPGNSAQQNLCIRNCQRLHELSHVKDILAQDPNICKGVANDTPVLNNDPNNDLLNSEQRAHQVEADCLADCAKKCPGQNVTDRQNEINKWIEDHQYE